MKKIFHAWVLLSAAALLTVMMLTAVAVMLPNCVQAQTLQWEQTNGPYGGNIIAFAILNGNLFTGVLGGGVYRSTNNGDTWMQVNNGLSTDNYLLALAANSTMLFRRNS